MDLPRRPRPGRQGRVVIQPVDGITKSQPWSAPTIAAIRPTRSGSGSPPGAHRSSPARSTVTRPAGLRAIALASSCLPGADHRCRHRPATTPVSRVARPAGCHIGGDFCHLLPGGEKTEPSNWCFSPSRSKPARSTPVMEISVSPPREYGSAAHSSRRRSPQPGPSRERTEAAAPDRLHFP